MKFKRSVLMAGCIAVIVLILGAGVIWTVEDNRKMETFLEETDRFIADYERVDYEKYKKMETVSQSHQQDGVENEETETVQELATIYTEMIESYPDPTTVEYEEPETEWDLYAEYSSLDWLTWSDVVAKAAEMGIDEHTLRIFTGWTANEAYVWYDIYLAYLCANCPLHYWASGEYVPDGLAGWDWSGTYSEENLVNQSYRATQEELRIVYLSLVHPRYEIFGCDGLSWYTDARLIYESYVEGYTIRVWAK